MTTERDRILSEFIDAWNRGERPDVDDYVSRVADDQRGELADQLITFLSFAPTPSYSPEALEEISEEAAVAEALTAPGRRGGLLPAMLATLRERLGMTTADVAEELVGELELPADRIEKTAGYLDRLEAGQLEPARVSRRVFGALARLFGVPRDELEGAGDIGSWGPSPAAVFRMFDADIAAEVSGDLEVFADAVAMRGGEDRDEVDDLFLGGR